MNEFSENNLIEQTAIKGTCEPSQLLDLIENFILFDDSRGERIRQLLVASNIEHSRK